MKKILLLAALVAFPFCLNAQEPEKKTHKVFCELVGTSKLLSAKVNVEIDFGQNPYKDSRIVDEKGKAKTFNSMVDAMNFMGQLGWEFEQAYVISVGGQNVYHWLLSKDLVEGETINEGLTTKSDLKEKKE